MKLIISMFAMLSIVFSVQAEPGGMELSLPVVPSIKMCGKSNTCKTHFKTDEINMVEAFEELNKAHVKACHSLMYVSSDLVLDVKGEFFKLMIENCHIESLLQMYNPYLDSDVQILHSRVLNVEKGIHLVYASEAIRTKSEKPTKITKIVDFHIEQLGKNITAYQEAYAVMYVRSLTK